jgi:hypothetical protein
VQFQLQSSSCCPLCRPLDSAARDATHSSPPVSKSQLINPHFPFTSQSTLPPRVRVWCSVSTLFTFVCKSYVSVSFPFCGGKKPAYDTSVMSVFLLTSHGSNNFNNIWHGPYKTEGQGHPMPFFCNQLTLTLNLLMSTTVAPPSNASKWQMRFNSAFKGLTRPTRGHGDTWGSSDNHNTQHRVLNLHTVTDIY